MKKQGKKGIFITFEGPEGSGKSLQAKKICKYLKAQGFPVIHTREPGGTDLGRVLRKILLNPRNKIDSKTELFLNFADRAEHMEQVIKPALKEGRIIICERFNDATLAYQGYGRGLDRSLIKKIGYFVGDGIIPDLTLLLDISVQQGLKRAVNTAKDFKKGKADRLEQEKISFHRKVRRGYLAIAREAPGRIKVISGTGSIEEVFGEIVRCINIVIKIK
ncbi:dTMP kinase [bacterium]|nr:dTMP kinase [bacterium]